MTWTEIDSKRMDHFRKQLTKKVDKCDNSAIRDAAEYGILIEKARLESKDSDKEFTISQHKFLLGGQIDLFIANCSCKNRYE